MRVIIPAFNVSNPMLWMSDDLRLHINGMGHQAGLILMDPPGVDMADLERSLRSIDYDAVLAVNLARSDFKGIIPADKPFLTLIMDIRVGTHSNETAEAFNASPSDWMFGYVDTLSPYGFDKSRLVQTDMPVSTRKFFSRERFVDRVKTIHKILFATNRGFAFPDIVRMRRDVYLSKGIDVDDVMLGCLSIDAHYNSANNGRLLSSEEIERAFTAEPSIRKAKLADPSGWPLFFEIYFRWHLHEAIWRQTIVRRCVEVGDAIVVCGQGWCGNDEFHNISIPPARHGIQLSDLYSTYSTSLHAGCRNHHRVTEILLSSGRVGFVGDDGVTIELKDLTLPEADSLAERQLAIVDDALHKAFSMERKV